MIEVTETLPESGSATATAQSPSANTSQERNSKKSKRAREPTELHSTSPVDGIVQETPVSAGLKSPESAQWRTPVETPNNAWGRKLNYDPLEKEVVSDEEPMEEIDPDPNCPVIPVSKEEKERLRRPWRRTLIVKVLGRKVSYSYLFQRLQRMWKPDANFDLIAIDQDYFLARFDSLRDYEFAKYEGPWIILGHYLTVQEWEPNFFPHKNKLNKLLVWVRFPTLPIEYFDDEFLAKIGRNIGRPVKVDTTTSLISIGKFARICVEVDVTKPLLAKFTVGGEVVPIEYEGIQMVCFSCGIYGHRQGQCRPDNQNEGANTTEVNPDRGQNNDPVAPNDQPVVHKVSKPTRDLKQNFGDWMLVARKERRGQRRGGIPPTGTPPNGRNQSPPANTGGRVTLANSRFAILDGLNDNDGETQVTPRTNMVADQSFQKKLPTIRTTQTQQAPMIQSQTPYQAPNRQPNTANRGNQRGRGGRGGAPRRAAAETEHTVVRGRNYGKQISTTVVHHQTDIPESSCRNDMDFELLGDPPDIPRVFANRPVDHDEHMFDDGGQFDQGPLAHGLQCS